jgi:hypothetical protein
MYYGNNKIIEIEQINIKNINVIIYAHENINAVQINPKQGILKQIYFKRMDDDHKENTGCYNQF